jgi:hypothetical protein
MRVTSQMNRDDFYAAVAPLDEAHTRRSTFGPAALSGSMSAGWKASK